MISYLKGKLVYKGENSILIETSDIGYQVLVSLTTLAKMPSIGEELKIFTHMNVKEDGITLFGFFTKEEQEMFLKLLSVGGVGPKGALGFLSELSPQQIVMAIISGDSKTLSKAPGVGKKTAERVILELKDKCKTQDGMAQEYIDLGNSQEGDPTFEAMEAMTALGYSQSEAAKAIGQIAKEGMTTEAILKVALKKMIVF